ncbi:MAG: serine hydrolase [Bacteroidetes bacterium]|nr:serine hydrolase [Bacteroidota bacterium]
MLKYLKLLLLCSLLLNSSCKVGRFIVYNFADISDYKIFTSKPLKSSNTKFTFNESKTGKIPKKINDIAFDDFLKKNKTVAFIVIKNDTIQYENYFNGYNKESIVASFSMAKSFTSILIGCAIDDGLINSINDPITNYLPELEKNGLNKVKIKHLLQMTSGIKYNESYFNPFGDAASYYYGTKLQKQVLKMKLIREPGIKFEYISGNTQLLGEILNRVLKGKTITTYFQEKIWTPLEMEYDASWSTDKKNGIEKTFCCVNARARDFAKIGRLFEQKGKWNGKQIVSEKWVKESTKPDTTEGGAKFYRNQWWLPTVNGDFMAQGFLGQYIYVNPAKSLIIVRLGKNEGKANWWTLLPSLAAQY